MLFFSVAHSRGHPLWLAASVILFEDITVLWGEGVLPSIPKGDWLERFSNRRVSIVYVTEDDMDNPRHIEEKIALFLNDYGMKPERVKAFIMIARNPTDNWGAGFPFKLRISLFPKEAYELYTSEESEN